MQIPKLNIVPDTGFYIAATLKDGYARSYLIGKGSNYLSYQLYSSEAILLEVQFKLENKFGYDRPKVIEAIGRIRKIVSIVHPSQIVKVVRDADDNKILECALEANAKVVLAFDKDLLDIKDYEGIKIVHPSALKYWFLDPK
jgi:putative PIN family toxin of toxin-antitoxin system